jgi:rhodanese-related sulfurtransferase
VKKTWIIVLGLMLALTAVVPAVSQDWLDRQMVSATEKFLTTMPADFYLIDPLAAQRLMEATKPFILDVRERSEFDGGERIAGAVNIPLRELPKALDRLPDGKGTPIVVYCAIGHRGAVAMMALRLWGYTNVRSIRNGLNGWKAAGLAIATK